MSQLRHPLALFLIFCICSSTVVSQTESTREDSRAKKRLDRLLGDRNTSRLVLPFENTVIVDGTEEYQISSFSYGSKLDFRKTMKKSARNITQKDKKLLALIVVMSQHVPHEKIQREVIRKTYAQWAPELGMKVVFFLGIKLSQLTSQVASSLIDEINTFGDIVLDNMNDHYHRLTAKVLRSFKWFLRRYSNEALKPTFFVKTDTDTFINLHHLADVLQRVPDQNNFIGGRVRRNDEPYRDPQSKWYMPLSYWSEERYPDFAVGMFYVFSSGLLPVVLNASLTEPFLHLEDVYITGIISKQKLKLNLTEMPGFIDLQIDNNSTQMVPSRRKHFMFHLPHGDLSAFIELYSGFNVDRIWAK